MFNEKEFKKWCKENGKNPAYTKNVVEFMETQDAPTRDEELEEQGGTIEQLLGKDAKELFEEKMDNVFIARFKDIKEEKSKSFRFALAGATSNKEVAIIIAKLMNVIVLKNRSFNENDYPEMAFKMLLHKLEKLCKMLFIFEEYAEEE